MPMENGADGGVDELQAEVEQEVERNNTLPPKQPTQREF